MNEIVDEQYFDLIIDNNVVDLYKDIIVDRVYQINPKYSIVLIPASKFSMCELGTYPYGFFPSILTLTGDYVEGSNIYKVQSNPNLALFGKGVLVAVIDTGIDYQHPAFKNSDNSTRIYSIWDQTINDSNNTPNGFSYGAEYTKVMINLALLNENPISIVPSVDEIGHGTSIAGIIGGSPDKEQKFSGVVPQCEFVIVKLKPAKTINKEVFCIPPDKLCYEETDIIAGLTYVTSVAQKLHRPLVVCLALGTSQAGNTGLGQTSGYLDYLTQTPGIGISVAAGNEGNKRRHYFGEITTPYYKDFELNICVEDESFFMEIWADSPYRLAIDIISPTGEAIRGIFPRINECRTLNFILTLATVYVNNIITESNTGEQLILIRFRKSISGIWRFRVYSIDNENINFHAWLPSGDLITENTFFIDSTPEITVTSPGNASSPLTLANYDLQTGAISIDSGRGYTRNNVIKPDLAAPGSNINCPIPNNSYASITGTGASAAHSTGIMAMIFEWAVVNGNNTRLTGSELNKILIRGASRSEDTEYPNRSWGYGAMDIFGSFEKLTI